MIAAQHVAFRSYQLNPSRPSNEREGFDVSDADMQQNDTKKLANPFGDYIVYVDESGDHSLTSIDPAYPIFVLTFCIFEKAAYIDLVCPAMQRFKFRYWGHDFIVLHEYEIVKRRGQFSFLLEPRLRDAFYADLNALMIESPFTLITVTIDKRHYRDSGRPQEHIYHVAMRYGLTRVQQFLMIHQQLHRTTPIVFEQRGFIEDRLLSIEFHSMCETLQSGSRSSSLELVMAPKSGNLCGLQVADLSARPIGRYILNPIQPNRAIEVLLGKFRCGVLETMDDGIAILT